VNVTAAQEQRTGYADAATQRVAAENGIEYAYRDDGASDVPLILLQHFRGRLTRTAGERRSGGWLFGPQGARVPGADLDPRSQQFVGAQIVGTDPQPSRHIPAAHVFCQLTSAD
jgi:hypothetical protein